jgi:hypothetical protein
MRARAISAEPRRRGQRRHLTRDQYDQLDDVSSACRTTRR